MFDIFLVFPGHKSNRYTSLSRQKAWAAIYSAHAQTSNMTKYANIFIHFI